MSGLARQCAAECFGTFCLVFAGTGAIFAMMRYLVSGELGALWMAFGLLPIALERSALYSPLAWVIIGGLITSTLLTRVVTPVVYKLLAPEVARQGAVGSGPPAPETPEFGAESAHAAGYAAA